MNPNMTTAALIVSAALSIAGCTEKPEKAANRYPQLPLRDVPIYLKDSIYEFADLSGTEPAAVSGYGLVVHLHGTGGSRAPTPVREYMIKELARHEFGSLGTGFASPEAILNSNTVSIVRIDGQIPPGARIGKDWNTWFDVRVSALPESETTSLAHGDLYMADLKVNGANPSDPGNGQWEVQAQAVGPVFVNPAYALDDTNDATSARVGRRTGIVLAGARAMINRPLILQLRAPGMQTARAIERRIIERFQDVLDDDLRESAAADTASPFKVANAKDEGTIQVYVPRMYTNDWAHFAGIVTHLCLNGGSPQFVALRAKELADAAVVKDAPLLDISYSWEGLGKGALYAVQPLLTHPNSDVQFAAARAAAFLGDPSAVSVLLSIAQSKGNPYRVTAVNVLAALPATPRVDRLCRVLLDSDEALVRIEAYKLLCKHGDLQSVHTTWVTDNEKQKFAVDVVKSDGLPMVYATQQGISRIAVFGYHTSLDLPIMFDALDRHLSIASQPGEHGVSIFYGGPGLRKPIVVRSGPNIADIAASLAGNGNVNDYGLHFSYADVVAILQTLIDGKRVSGSGPASAAVPERIAATFVLQEPIQLTDPIAGGRPLTRDGSRPAGDKPGPQDKPERNKLIRPGMEDPVPTTGPSASAAR